MRITYFDHKTGQSGLYGKGPNVLGWTVLDHETQKETLYALHPDGRIKRTDKMDRTNHFNLAKRAWFDATTIPDDAEYCGAYIADMF